MSSRDYTYVICRNQSERLAMIGDSEHLGVLVSAMLPMHATLYVDVLTTATDESAHSWRVDVHPYLGVPVWTCLPREDAERRCAMHIVQDVQAAIELCNNAWRFSFLPDHDKHAAHARRYEELPPGVAGA